MNQQVPLTEEDRLRIYNHQVEQFKDPIDARLELYDRLNRIEQMLNGLSSQLNDIFKRLDEMDGKESE